MGKLRDTKKDIIHGIIAAAAQGRFTRDKRVRDLPPIALEDFQIELSQCGEKRLRARLSHLSRAELIGAMQEWAEQQSELMDRIDREATARAFSERQSERGRRDRLQPAILAAARHYRGRGANAGEAWDAIKKSSFTTDDGETVEIEGSKDHRLKQTMRAVLPNRKHPRLPIRFAQWRQTYWTAAAKPG
jgi:hypothetical protein